MANCKTIIDGYTVEYLHKSELEEMHQEIFLDQTYHFSTKNDKPLIIDAGANIGLSTLYFKRLYPNAKIICFEPNPEVFKLLQNNISHNNLKDVTLINSALSAQNNISRNFYLDNANGKHDTLGASLYHHWVERENCEIDEISVNTTNLADYINQQVDYLKMDIEGSEFEVLASIDTSLPNVKAFNIEVHEINDRGFCNETAGTLIDRLLIHGFHITTQRKNLLSCLPEKLHNWVRSKKPSLTMVRGEM